MTALEESEKAWSIITDMDTMEYSPLGEMVWGDVSLEVVRQALAAGNSRTEAAVGPKRDHPVSQNSRVSTRFDLLDPSTARLLWIPWLD